MCNKLKKKEKKTEMDDGSRKVLKRVSSKKKR